MNDFAKHLEAYDRIKPFSGQVPAGFLFDPLGMLTDVKFRAMWGVDPASAVARTAVTKFPDPSDLESFCETVGWLEAACEARRSYTMVTLGACYGAQAVDAFFALKRVNPMPAKLVAIEPDPGNFAWLKKHFRDNGLDPDHHWLINCAVSDGNRPVLFPVGATGTGSGNCMSTNPESERAIYAAQMLESGNLPDVVRRLVVRGETSIEKSISIGADQEFKTRLAFVSAMTLADVLAPLDYVDLLDSDIQQSEIIVFPPAMEMIADKVRRVHIGTHGTDAHTTLLKLFLERGFEIVFDLRPGSEYNTEWGSFTMNDGVITALNPELAP